MEPCFRLQNIPVRSKAAKDELVKMRDTFVFNPLPAYDVNGDRISPADYESALRGATVLVTFTLTHYHFKQSGTREASDTFVADIVKIRVLAPPAPEPVPRFTMKRVRARDTDDFAGALKKVKSG